MSHLMMTTVLWRIVAAVMVVALLIVLRTTLR